MKDATPFPCTLSTAHKPQSIDGSGFLGCAASPTYSLVVLSMAESVMIRVRNSSAAFVQILVSRSSL